MVSRLGKGGWIPLTKYSATARNWVAHESTAFCASGVITSSSASKEPYTIPPTLSALLIRRQSRSISKTSYLTGGSALDPPHTPLQEFSRLHTFRLGLFSVS